MKQAVTFVYTLLFISVFNILLPAENLDKPKTVVELFGAIHAEGNRIVDKNGNPAALHGMSLFWSQWGGDFYNEECIKWLVNDWNCTVVRAACGVEMGGYLKNPAEELAKVRRVIDASLKLGIYVVVDWHDHNAHQHTQKAKEFFKTIAQDYGSKENIIYEIYNEPLKISWKDSVKPYLEEVIKEIRKYDPDNLITVGSPTFSQDVDIAVKDPINDKNVAYSLHYYTSTHKQYLRDKALEALNKGFALFVNEFGISEASGNGIIDYAETALWFDFVKQHSLSTLNWSVIDKNETSAALKPGASPTGGWSEDELSESGKFIRENIRKLNAPFFQQLKGE